MTGATGARSVDGIVLQRPRYDNKNFPFFSSFVLIKTKPPDKGWRSLKTAINQSLLFVRKKRLISGTPPKRIFYRDVFETPQPVSRLWVLS